MFGSILGGGGGGGGVTGVQNSRKVRRISKSRTVSLRAFVSFNFSHFLTVCVLLGVLQIDRG